MRPGADKLIDDERPLGSLKIIEMPSETRDRARLLSSLHRLNMGVKEFGDMKSWLESNFIRITAEQVDEVDMNKLKWNQGALQVLSDLFRTVESARQQLEVIQGG